MKIEVININKYNEIANLLLSNQTKPMILCLSGDLGAGKTTFTQAIGSTLNIDVPVKSPTFTIHNEYNLENNESKLHHLDLYRLNSKQELDELNIKDLCIDSNVVVIEWADKFADYLNEFLKVGQVVWINFTYVDENTRLVEIDL